MKVGRLDKNIDRTQLAKTLLTRNQDITNNSAISYNNYCSTGTINNSLSSSSLSQSNKEKIKTIKATLARQKEYKYIVPSGVNDQMMDHSVKYKTDEASSRVGSPSSSYNSAHPLKNKTNITSNTHRGGTPTSSSRVSTGYWNKENAGDTARIKVRSKDNNITAELSCRSKKASPSPSLEKYNNSEVYIKKNQELKERIKKSFLSTRQDFTQKRENVSQEEFPSSRNESRANSPKQVRQSAFRESNSKDAPHRLDSTLSNLKRSIEMLKSSKITNANAKSKRNNNSSKQGDTLMNNSLIGKIVNQSLRLSADRQDSSVDEKESMNDSSARKQHYASERYGTSSQNPVKRVSQRPSDMSTLKPMSQNMSLLKTEAARWKSSSSRCPSKQRYGACMIQAEHSQQELVDSFEGSSVQQIRSVNESTISGIKARASQERDLQLPKGVCEDNVKIFDVLKNVYRNSKLLYINDR